MLLSGPPPPAGRPDLAPECPDTWGKFDLGEVFRRELTIPAESPRQYRIEWFILGEDGSNPDIIRIADVRKLPVMPAQD